MKISFVITLLMASTVAVASISIPKIPQGNSGANYRIPRTPTGPSTVSPIGIPKGEKERMLAQEVAELTGLIKQDVRYVNALSNCAIKSKAITKYFQELVIYLNSAEFKKQSDQAKGNDLTMASLEVKMSCGEELERNGIDP